ncbi:tetratricopeptide repeat protein [Planctomycetota bacterium]
MLEKLGSPAASADEPKVDQGEYGDVDLLTEVERYRERVEKDPENPHYWFLYGVALAPLGRHEEAAAALENAVSLAPGHAKAWYWLGAMRKGLEDHEGAVKAYEQATTLAQEWAEAWCDMAVSLAETGLMERSLEALDEALRLSPGDGFTWASKAAVLRNAERNEEALEAFKRATECDPSRAETWNGRGEVHAVLGQSEAALECFQSSVECDPDCLNAWYNLGMLLGEMGRNAESITPLNEALRLGCREPAVYFSLVLAQVEKGDLEAALKTCDQAMTEFEDPNMYAVRATVLTLLRRFEECIQFVEASHARDITHPRMAQAGARSLVGLERYEEARRVLVGLLDDDAGDADARALAGYCMFKLGRMDEALAAVEDAAKANPSSGEPWRIRALIACEQSRVDEMLSCLRTALDLDPDAAVQIRCMREFECYWDMPDVRQLLGL